MNFIVDYFSEPERQSSWYKQILDLIDKTDLHCSPKSRDEFFYTFEKVDLANHIIILTHGNRDEDLIVHSGLYSNAIFYGELIEILNLVKNGDNIKLNMVGICYSNKIVPYINLLHNKFSEVWFVNGETTAFHAPFHMIEDGFEYFVETRYSSNNLVSPFERIQLHS